MINQSIEAQENAALLKTPLCQWVGLQVLSVVDSHTNYGPALPLPVTAYTLCSHTCINDDDLKIIYIIIVVLGV